MKNAITGRNAGHVPAVMKAHHNAADREEVESQGIAWMSDWEDALKQMLPDHDLAQCDGP